MRQSDRVGLGTIASIRVNQGRKSRLGARRIRRDLEAGEPTVAREHVCGPGVILTTSVKGAREGARVKIMSVGCPQTAGRASMSGAGLAFVRRRTKPNA